MWKLAAALLLRTLGLGAALVLPRSPAPADPVIIPAGRFFRGAPPGAKGVEADERPGRWLRHRRDLVRALPEDLGQQALLDAEAHPFWRFVRSGVSCSAPYRPQSDPFRTRLRIGS